VRFDGIPVGPSNRVLNSAGFAGSALYVVSEVSEGFLVTDSEHNSYTSVRSVLDMPTTYQLPLAPLLAMLSLAVLLFLMTRGKKR
jgi:hypothetical protein